MQQDNLFSEPIELTAALPNLQGVRFDPDKVTLEGSYKDELSLFRARKSWGQTLESYFLLDKGHDFVIHAESEMSDAKFTLTCEFVSACARYAFWRLTNNQALEAQYLIETAHIPNCRFRQEDLIEASDLKSILDFPNSPIEPKNRSSDLGVLSFILKFLLRK